MTQVERLLEAFEELELWRKKYEEDLETPYGKRERAYLHEQLNRIRDRQARIRRRVYEVEGCEHANVEDTGGPDGSQICIDCGRIN